MKIHLSLSPSNLLFHWCVSVVCTCLSVSVFRCARSICIICMTRRRRTCPMDHWNKQNRSHRCSHWQQCQKPRWVPNELPPTNDPLLCRKTYLLERILLHLFTQFRRGFPLAGCNIVDRSKCVTALVWVGACHSCTCVYFTRFCCFVCVSVLVNSVGVNHSFKKKNTRNSWWIWLLFFTVIHIIFAAFFLSVFYAHLGPLNG